MGCVPRVGHYCDKYVALCICGWNIGLCGDVCWRVDCVGNAMLLRFMYVEPAETLRISCESAVLTGVGDSGSRGVLVAQGIVAGVGVTKRRSVDLPCMHKVRFTSMVWRL